MLKIYIAQQYIGKQWIIYTVKACSKKAAKEAAVAKGADPNKSITISR